LSSDSAVVIVTFLMNIVPFGTLYSYLPIICRYNMVDMQLHVVVNKSGKAVAEPLQILMVIFM